MNTFRRNVVSASLPPSVVVIACLSLVGCGGRLSTDAFADPGPGTDATSPGGDASLVDSSPSHSDSSVPPGTDTSTKPDTLTGLDAREVGVTKCTDDGGCGGLTPHCDPSVGTCTGCTAAVCKPAGLVCDPASGACVECTSDGDCRGGVCDLAAHACTTKCSGAAGCRAPSTCEPSSGTCVECLSDSACRGGRCDLATRTCVECLTVADCGPGTTICDSMHTCTLECTSEAQCAPFRAHCDPTTSHCYECYRNDQCARAEVCQADHTCG